MVQIVSKMLFWGYRGGRGSNFCQNGVTYYLGRQGRVDVEFQTEVKTLIHIITANRNRRTTGPVLPLYHRFCYIDEQPLRVILKQVH